MQRVLWIIVAIVFGLNFGALTALWLGGIISSGPSVGNTIEVSGWQSDWSIGSENANPYVRARVARNGLLAMRKEEAVYFIKVRDDAGRAFREDCAYRVSGNAIPANWWSITLYDGDSRLPMNDDNRLSYDQTKAAAQFGDAAWDFVVSPTSPNETSSAWVSSRAAGAFDLTLRLYEPDPALLADPKSVLVPPAVTRLSCAAEAG